MSRIVYIDKKRHIVREEIASIEIIGSLESVIHNLESLHERFVFDYKNLNIELEYEGCGCVLYGERKENEKEKNYRLAKEKKERDRRQVSIQKQKERIMREAEKLGMKMI